MKILCSVFSILLVASIARGEVPFYQCSSNQLGDFVSYIQGEPAVLTKALSSEQIDTLETEFDLAFDCNEGVNLEGPVNTDGGVAYLATCYVDSLGAKQVALQLSCEKKFTIN